MPFPFLATCVPAAESIEHHFTVFLPEK